MNTKNRQVDKKTTKQVRLDNGIHRLVKIESAKGEKTIREYIEEVLVEYWEREGVKW